MEEAGNGTKFIGVDVSKGKLDYSAWAGGGRRKSGSVPNDAKGVGRLARMALERGLAVCCEPTGGYERPLVDACLAAGAPVYVADAYKVRHYAVGAGRLAKTDAIDAAVIGAFAEAGLAREARPRPRAVGHLKELVALRADVEGDVARARSRLEHASDPFAAAMLRKRLRNAEADVRRIDAEIRAAAGEDAGVAGVLGRMQSVSGVGLLTAATFVALLPGCLDGMTGKEAGKLVGVAPMDSQSGKTDKARHMARGIPAARSCLYMAALVAARRNAVPKGVYERLRGAGKTPKVALCAVARKLAELLCRIASDPDFRPSADKVAKDPGKTAPAA